VRAQRALTRRWDKACYEARPGGGNQRRCWRLEQAVVWRPGPALRDACGYYRCWQTFEPWWDLAGCFSQRPLSGHPDLRPTQTERRPGPDRGRHRLSRLSAFRARIRSRRPLVARHVLSFRKHSRGPVPKLVGALSGVAGPSPDALHPLSRVQYGRRAIDVPGPMGTGAGTWSTPKGSAVHQRLPSLMAAARPRWRRSGRSSRPFPGRPAPRSRREAAWCHCCPQYTRCPEWSINLL